MTEIERRLNKFIFPVEERKVFFADPNGNPKRSREYKAIVRKDKNKLISVMEDTYQLVPNRDVIMPLLEQLHQLDTRWNFDNSHSFVESKRMRLQVTFPDLTLNDGRSDIALSLFLHNSYDGSEGVRMFWGAIRAICSNGMVFGDVLSKFYSKHTKNINLNNLKEQLEETYEKIPVIKERIDILKNLSITKEVNGMIKDKLGATISKYVDDQPNAENQWILYNMLTYYISHIIERRMRASYQMRVSKLFRL
jgi:Domain of unknown function (DUF932)